MDHYLSQKPALQDLSKGDYLIFHKKRIELVYEVDTDKMEVYTQRLTRGDPRLTEVIPIVRFSSGYRFSEWEYNRVDDEEEGGFDRIWTMDVSVDSREFAKLQEENSPLIRTLTTPTGEVA